MRNFKVVCCFFLVNRLMIVTINKHCQHCAKYRMLIVSLLTKITDNNQSQKVLPSSPKISVPQWFCFCYAIGLNSTTLLPLFSISLIRPEIVKNSSNKVWMYFWYYTSMLSCKPLLDTTVPNLKRFWYSWSSVQQHQSWGNKIFFHHKLLSILSEPLCREFTLAYFFS